MPAKSKAQLKMMRAVANSPKFAKKVGIKPSVGKEMVAETPKGAKLPARAKGKKK